MSTVVTQTVARLLLAPILVVAVAVMVKGASAVGDGFAAGLIAALGVLIQYLASGWRAAEEQLPIGRAPQFALGGLLAMLALAGQSLARGEPLLTHWPPPDEEPLHFGTVELTTSLGFELGAFLLVSGMALTAVHAAARLADEEDA